MGGMAAVRRSGPQPQPSPPVVRVELPLDLRSSRANGSDALSSSAEQARLMQQLEAELEAAAAGGAVRSPGGALRSPGGGAARRPASASPASYSFLAPDSDAWSGAPAHVSASASPPAARPHTSRR